MAVYHSQTDTKPINEMFPAISMTNPQLDVWISPLNAIIRAINARVLSFLSFLSIEYLS